MGVMATDWKSTKEARKEKYFKVEVEGMMLRHGKLSKHLGCQRSQVVDSI